MAASLQFDTTFIPTSTCHLRCHSPSVAAPPAAHGPEKIRRRMHFWRKGSQPEAVAMYERLVEKDDERCSDGRAPKGCVPVLVGEEDECVERFLMQVKLLRDPRITALLEMTAGEFGYRQQGILRIPCDAEYFRQVLRMLAKAR
ncbi:hypothetical protein J5N97_009035 [Dioscorea zingiberensis]|uniref:Uncharacterized protein n=1 Tax=Dioscorea zingiberensis TaxID=325984 RepID=A0A9D5CVM1_9LILI|nr:hypothetical protein J5N97_009035 [Dioscorea zingiberensis]